MKKSTFIMILILSLVFGVFSFIISLKQIPYSAVLYNEMYITNEDEFIFYTENYNLYDVACLKKDIIITKSFKSIGPSNDKFNGIFNGCGYSITLEKEASGIPLFNIIDSEGQVKNLEVYLNKCLVNSTSYAIIANQNRGKIENIIVYVDETIIQKDTIFGCIASYNTGNISHCYIETRIYNKINQSRKASIIGGCCGYNDGKIQSVIVNIDNFSSLIFDSILNNEVNFFYGIVCGENNRTLNGLSSCYYLNKIPYLFSDSKYVVLINSLSEEILLNKYLFDNRIWILTNDPLNNKIKLSLKDGVTI